MTALAESVASGESKHGDDTGSSREPPLPEIEEAVASEPCPLKKARQMLAQGMTKDSAQISLRTPWI